MFEEKSSYGMCNDTSSLEDGLLEKIINLSIYNLKIFDQKPWNIIAVKSPKLKYKLYTLSKKQDRLMDSAVDLIIIDGNPGFAAQKDVNLLALSVMYAAKYYFVDFFFTTDTDFDAVREELRLPADKKPVMVICLGYFCNSEIPCLQQNKTAFKNFVEVR